MKRALMIMVVCAYIVCASTWYADAKQGKRIRFKASNHHITRDIPVFRSFDAIHATGIVDVEYRQSTDGKTSVRVYGPDNVIEHLEVLNEGGTLVARLNKIMQISNIDQLKVIASSPRLKKVSASGNSDVTLIGEIRAADLILVGTGNADIQFDAVRCDNLKIQCSGNGEVEGRQTECRTLDMATSGNGDVSVRQIASAAIKIVSSGNSDVEIAGNTNDVTISVSGTSEVDAFGLRAQKVNVRASGVSEVSCYAERRLDANASGRSEIVFGGNPTSVNISGNVNPRQSQRPHLQRRPRR